MQLVANGALVVVFLWDFFPYTLTHFGLKMTTDALSFLHHKLHHV